MKLSKGFTPKVSSHNLFSLNLELTWRRNDKIDNPKFRAEDELSADEWKNILEQARAMGCVRVTLSGGEVLLRPDFCDIAAFAVNLGYIVDVYTTGVGLTHETFSKMCALTLNSISFSLYSGEAELHDKITGVKGSFEETLQAMHLFKSAGVHTIIKGVIIRQNVHRLKSFYELGRRLEVEVDGSPENFLLDKVYTKNSSRELGEEESVTISMGFGKNSLTINPFGEINSLGSVREQSLKNLWNKIDQ